MCTSCLIMKYDFLCGPAVGNGVRTRSMPLEALLSFKNVLKWRKIYYAESDGKMIGQVLEDRRVGVGQGR